MDANYNSFLDDIRSFVDSRRIYTDDLRLLAWGTDAGFYRLLPKIVIRSDNEAEVSKLLAAASRRLQIPYLLSRARTGRITVSPMMV